MPVEILMPKLGLTMAEGQVVEWRKQEGQSVAAGEILFVLETEKVTYEVEAPADGVLARILVPAGETVAVGTVVAYLLAPGEDPQAIPAAPPAVRVEAASAAPAPQAAAPAPNTPAPAGGRVRATPLAKKLAREKGLDLATLKGSGSGGRILADDVRAAAAGPAVSPAAVMPEGQPRLVPFSNMRRAIGRNMMFSKTQTAQTYMSITADASALVAHRQALLPYVQERHGVRLTITDLMMKISGAAVAAHPVLNTRWSAEGVLFLPEVHMGMAMALDEGLIVPVIRGINHKSLGQIAAERSELIKKGRESRFLPDDITGSTFTLSTLGMFGIESFTANINPPESAILAVGAIIEKPAAREGQVVVRPQVNLTLTYDHRIIDGAEAGKFMRTLGELCQDPIKLLA